MKFGNIHLTNWCQHHSLKIDKFDDNSVAICGDNNTGKTSLLRAMCWMLDTGKSEFGGKEDITDGETYCRVEATINFGTYSHVFAKWIENSSNVAETAFSIDDNKLSATQYKKFIVARVGTEDYLSLLIARQEDIHATIREPKVARNRKLRATLGIDKPEGWGKEIKQVWQDAAKTQARSEGVASEKLNGLNLQKSQLFKDILVKETESSNNTPVKDAKEALVKIEEGTSFLRAFQEKEKKASALQTEIRNAETRNKEIDEELALLPGKDLEEARKKEEAATIEAQLASTGSTILDWEAKKSLVTETDAKKIVEIILKLETGLTESNKIEGELSAALQRKENAEKAIDFPTQNIDADLEAWESFFQKNPIARNLQEHSSPEMAKQLQSLFFQAGLNAAEELSKIKALSPKEALGLLEDYWKNFNESPDSERIDPVTGESFLQKWTSETYETRKAHLLEQQKSHKGEGSRENHRSLLQKSKEYEKAASEIPQNLGSYKELGEKKRLTDTANTETLAYQQSLAKKEKFLKIWETENPGIPLTSEEKKTWEEKQSHLKNEANAKIASDNAIASIKAKIGEITDEELRSRAIKNVAGAPILQALVEQAKTAYTEAKNNEEKRAPKISEKFRLAGEIQTKQKQKEDIQKILDSETTKTLVSEGLNYTVDPANIESLSVLMTMKNEWTEKLERSQRTVAELDLLRQNLQKVEELEKEAQKEKELIYENGQLLEPLEELQSFLSAKKAPEMLLRSALTTILEDTNNLLPKAGLDAELRMDSSGDFEILYERNGKTVVEPARRQGVGFATILGMCLKLASTNIVAPQIRAVAFDEPSAAMSPKRRPMLGRFLKTLSETGEKQVIIVEHDPAVAESCNQTIHFRERKEIDVVMH